MGLRNVVHRRNHKERAQPAHRRKLGLLEKHKDYVERARDHHSKQDRLKRLQQKAALRNADEFNFGMIRAGGGRESTSAAEALLQHKRKPGQSLRTQQRPDASLDNDVVSLLKTQDLGYVRRAVRNEEKQMEQLRQEIRPGLAFMSDDWLHAKEGREALLIQQGLLQSPSDTSGGGRRRRQGVSDVSLTAPRRKTIWVDSVSEARSFKPGQSSSSARKASKNVDGNDTFGLSLDDELNFGSDLDEDESDGIEGSVRSAAPEKRLARLLTELASRQARLEALQEARSKLETVRSLLATRGQSTTKKTSDGGKKMDALKDAVAKGKVTPNGLALPGNDDDDDSDDDSGRGRKSAPVVFKWGRERKR